jgi:hypothetical protein
VRENRLHGSEGGESLEGLFSTPIGYKDVKGLRLSTGVYIHVSWTSAQISLEQICINPKGGPGRIA